MTEQSAFSEEFTSAMAELTGYIEETDRIEQEKAREKKKKRFGFKDKEPVPRKEADEEQEEDPSKKKSEEKKPEEESDASEPEPQDADEQADESRNEDDDSTKYEIVKSKKGVVSDKIAPRPRFADASDLVPIISKKCAETAVEAMRALRKAEKEYRRYVLVNIRDDGKRTITKYKAKEDALLAMHREMDVYVNEIEPKDRTKEVYEDDGDNEHIYEPTPPDQIAEDGTIKRPSEIDHTLHRKETDSRGIVYFETKNATARWDVYDLEEAVLGDIN